VPAPTRGRRACTCPNSPASAPGRSSPGQARRCLPRPEPTPPPCHPVTLCPPHVTGLARAGRVGAWPELAGRRSTPLLGKKKINK
jgi:hypothetical protein